MARGKAKGFSFSSHPGHGSAGRTAAGAKGQFRNISRKSTGGTTKVKPYQGK